jgi:hypothetical protein
MEMDCSQFVQGAGTISTDGCATVLATLKAAQMQVNAAYGAAGINFLAALVALAAAAVATGLVYRKERNLMWSYYRHIEIMLWASLGELRIHFDQIKKISDGTGKGPSEEELTATNHLLLEIRPANWEHVAVLGNLLPDVETIYAYLIAVKVGFKRLSEFYENGSRDATFEAGAKQQEDAIESVILAIQKQMTQIMGRTMSRRFRSQKSLFALHKFRTVQPLAVLTNGAKAYWARLVQIFR